MSIQDNLSVNTSHYDQLYDGLDIAQLVQKFKNPQELFERSQRKVLSTKAFFSEAFEQELSNKRVLEVGAGNGLITCLMSHFGALVTAHDISPKSTDLISKLATALNFQVSTYYHSLTQLPVDSRSFDFVVGKSILHHLTHELEEQYYQKIATLLNDKGCARFVEPAHNLPLLRKMLLVFPSGGRPSILKRQAYKTFKKNDPHPERDNSSKHYRAMASRFFHQVEIRPFGIEQSIMAFFPKAFRGRKLERALHKMLSILPFWFHLKLAKVQVILCAQPKRLAEA